MFDEIPQWLEFVSYILTIVIGLIVLIGLEVAGLSFECVSFECASSNLHWEAIGGGCIVGLATRYAASKWWRWRICRKYLEVLKQREH